MVYVVTYDLVEPNDTASHYTHIVDAIKSSFPTWCHIEQSVWLVDTSITAAEIRETLKPALSAGDRLFVARLTTAWASWNLGERRNQWLHAQLV